MMRLWKSKRILIPDVPPKTVKEINQELVVAGIGFLCATVVIAAVVFVFIGA
jgi:hypothetical protein